MATNYISADELAALVRDPTKTPGTDYLVVDVRDEDYHGGHIPGAINVPAHHVRDRAPELAAKYASVPTLVFHCALSQVRGPKSARIYNETVRSGSENAPENGSLVHDQQQVLVLRGGFNSWLHRFKDTEPALIEAYDASVPRDDF
ncbi:Cdc25 phosphatase Ibp1 [Coemansia sp. Benny D115]|nr:Cdc25 phosphatase Ibp1 [Coemansia sp. Benny D115]